tara:strand:- start:31 stop:642 length:612 start_codon:yes stop_codon:yes gene_type:complete
MPETKKKPRKPRAKRASAPAKKSKKGLKQKQKQRQQVNVNVSAGGSGGGGYIPIPQAPEINYSLLSQLIRPAATVDMPIRAAAPVPEAPFVRPAEPESLASELKPKRKYTRKPKTEIPVAEGYLSEVEPMTAKAMKPPYDISRSGGFSEREAEALLSSEIEGPFQVTAVKGKKGQRGRFEIGNPELGSRTFQEPSLRGGFGEL